MDCFIVRRFSKRQVSRCWRGCARFPRTLHPCTASMPLAQPPLREDRGGLGLVCWCRCWGRKTCVFLQVDVGRIRATAMDTGGGIGQVVSWGNRLSKTPYLASLCPEIENRGVGWCNVASWTHEGENREQEHERCCIGLESDEPDRSAGRVRSSLIVAR